MTSEDESLYRAMISRHIEIARRDADADAYTFTFRRDLQYKKSVIDHYWRPLTGAEIINPATGEITVVPEYVSYRGGDKTVSQLAEQLGIGPRQARSALLEIGMLHEETEVRAVPMVSDPQQMKPEYSSRLRLSEWAVKMRYGRRVRDTRGCARDWLTPTGQEYIRAMLAVKEALKPSTTERPKAAEIIGQLLAGDPMLRQVDIVRLTGLSKMTVHRNLRLLGKKVTSASPSVYISESGTQVA